MLFGTPPWPGFCNIHGSRAEGVTQTQRVLDDLPLHPVVSVAELDAGIPHCNAIISDAAGETDGASQATPQNRRDTKASNLLDDIPLSKHVPAAGRAEGNGLPALVRDRKIRARGGGCSGLHAIARMQQVWRDISAGLAVERAKSVFRMCDDGTLGRTRQKLTENLYDHGTQMLDQGVVPEPGDEEVEELSLFVQPEARDVVRA